MLKSIKNKCSKTNKCFSWSYRKFKCRCLECLNWKRTVGAKADRIRSLDRKRKYHDGDTVIQLRECHLRRLYNIDYLGYLLLAEIQNYKCMICEKQFDFKVTIGRETLRVDHCHSSKRIRGLLCDSCNLGLGKFRDNKEILKHAIKYLSQRIN